MTDTRLPRVTLDGPDRPGPSTDSAASSAPAVRTRALRKVYKGTGGKTVEALKGLDLEIPRGSFFGLLGPNGAGKSTFINILAGLVNRTSGSAEICGHDTLQGMRQARLSIGVVPQELVLDPFFTAREALDVQAGYYGVPARERRTKEILEAVGLADQADAYARTLSGGMRRRLMVAKSLVHNPPVVVLDEPTAGVDVELRQQLWAYGRKLNAAGTTVVLTTHYLEEAEELCDRIAIIHKGDLVACDDTPVLLSRLDNKELVIVPEVALDAVPAGLQGWDCELQGPRRLIVRYRRRQTEISDILDAVRAAGISILDITTHQSDLEDLFLHLIRSQPGAS